MSDRKFERRDSLFIRNISNEASELTLRSLFEKHGKVTHCTIPKDYQTGEIRPFGFVTFSSETEAGKAMEHLDNTDFLGRTLQVKYAKRRSPPRWSRSPSPHKKRRLESELKDRVEELQRSKSDLMTENSDLRRSLKNHKKRKEELKKEVEAYRSNSLIFLPCGHSKLVSCREKFLLEDLSKEALELLDQNQRNDANIARKVKARVAETLESKFPDFYRCRKQVTIINACGHDYTANCWEIRNFSKNRISPNCIVPVEVVFECGHKTSAECFNKGNVICRIC